ncbi:DUF2130 domain-containing protein [Candidatus Saccharibacteria bacterium]|nr:DUF2130 domain-containing protein [Candidatus Saccharibacteria bacterium]
MSHEVKCPNCGKTFTIDEVSYAEIQNQVRNAEFTRELEDRLRAVETTNRKEIENTKLAVASAYKEQLSNKEREILDLKSKIANANTERELAVERATKSGERELMELKNDLRNVRVESENAIANLKDRYEYRIKEIATERDFYKDLKKQMSTKMVGETLEQHCEVEFNKIRATGFKNATFGKDNTVSATGSKGDYIYRETDDAGNEIISIMFEMKNENETTATKHKNEHFFKELDKDRREKNCEYAVLVSLLESDNDFYNAGIVDVSYQSGFPKMYVVRPQCFVPIITILRNAAMSTLDTKAELARVKNQNIDITNFEQKLADFKSSFALNSDRATANFKKAIDDIDKSIKNLEDTKEALLKTIKNFDTAQGKLDDLTVKRLIRGNETMTKMFAKLDK